MLTLTSYNYLRDIGYDSVLKFAEDFIRIKTRLTASVDGSIKIKTDPVGYNNLQLLKRIIYTYINYKTGEQASVKRPCKITLPIEEKTTLCDSIESLSFKQIKPINTIINPTKAQQMCFDALQKYLLTQTDEASADKVFREWIDKQDADYLKNVIYGGRIDDIEYYQQQVSDMADFIKQMFNLVWNKKEERYEIVDKLFSGTAILKVLTAMRNVSLSPYMFVPYCHSALGIEFDFNWEKERYNLKSKEDITSKAFVESSGKLMYVLNCIREANAYQDKNGKARKGYVIYSNLGTDVGKNAPVSMVKMVKEYFMDKENKFGYKSGHIKHEDFRGAFGEVELLTGKETGKKPEVIMDLFNKGQIKVLITTKKEGVDLQGDTITLFNISVDWNPTDAKQVEGRAWRQGNANAYCIISYPLTANSSDVSIYQKLQDKTGRLKAIWDMANMKSQFDEEDWSPEDLKMSMISQPDKLAPFIYQQENQELERELSMLEGRYKKESEVIRDYTMFDQNVEYLRKALYMYATLPVVCRQEADSMSAKQEMTNAEQEVEYLEGRIEDAREDVEAYDKVREEKDTIEKLKEDIEKLELAEFKAYKSKDMESVDRIGKEVQESQKQIKESEEKIEKLLKDIDKQVEEKTKDLRAKLKEEQKKYKKAKEKMESERKPIFEYDPDLKLDVPLDDKNTGNFFITNDKGGIVYKHETANSLQNIDYSKATLFDLLEATKRLVKAYQTDSSFQRRALTDYLDNQSGYYREIYFQELLDSYKEWSTVELVKEFVEAIENYLPSDLEVDANKVIKGATAITTRTGQGAEKRMYNIGYIESRRGSILRNLREYKGIVGTNDPDEYLQALADKIEALKEQTSEGGLMNMPDNIRAKYIDKAVQIIAKQSEDYNDYLKLVDGYMSLKHTFNIPYSDVIDVEVLPTKKEAEEETKIGVKEAEEKEAPKPKEDKAEVDEKAEIQQQIEDYEMLLEVADDEMKAEIQEQIEDYKMLLEVL